MKKSIELKHIIYRLDWIKILHEAIKARPTSWYDPAVREWRNAGDEVCSALIHALEEKGVVPTFQEEITPSKHTEEGDR